MVIPAVQPPLYSSWTHVELLTKVLIKSQNDYTKTVQSLSQFEAECRFAENQSCCAPNVLLAQMSLLSNAGVTVWRSTCDCYGICIMIAYVFCSELNLTTVVNER